MYWFSYNRTWIISFTRLQNVWQTCSHTARIASGQQRPLLQGLFTLYSWDLVFLAYFSSSIEDKCAYPMTCSTIHLFYFWVFLILSLTVICILRTENYLKLSLQLWLHWDFFVNLILITYINIHSDQN